MKDEGGGRRAEGGGRKPPTPVGGYRPIRQVIASSDIVPRPEHFHLLLDPPAAGAWNMAVDEALLEAAAADGLCALRFYRWEAPTLSLGYFQTYDERWQHAASRHCAVVRRASGGGAILHDRELTYSLAVPDRHPMAIDRLGLYRSVHTALIEALAEWAIEAKMVERPAEPSTGDAALRQPFLCFQRRSPGDVVIGETKVAGSAQRRCRGAVLQHGSVLLARSVAAPELAGIEELTGKGLPADELIAAWREKLAKTHGISWQGGELGETERSRAASLVVEKYACPAWMEKQRARFPGPIRP
jgi:lipoate-protein ligase A